MNPSKPKSNKRGLRNPNRRHLSRMLRASGLKTSVEAKALFLEMIAYNLRASRTAAEALAAHSGMGTITPTVAQTVLALRLSKDVFEETMAEATLYNAALRGPQEE